MTYEQRNEQLRRQRQLLVTREGELASLPFRLRKSVRARSLAGQIDTARAEIARLEAATLDEDESADGDAVHYATQWASVSSFGIPSTIVSGWALSTTPWHPPRATARGLAYGTYNPKLDFSVDAFYAWYMPEGPALFPKRVVYNHLSSDLGFDEVIRADAALTRRLGWTWAIDGVTDDEAAVYLRNLHGDTYGIARSLVLTSSIAQALDLLDDTVFLAKRLPPWYRSLSYTTTLLRWLSSATAVDRFVVCVTPPRGVWVNDHIVQDGLSITVQPAGRPDEFGVYFAIPSTVVECEQRLGVALHTLITMLLNAGVSLGVCGVIADTAVDAPACFCGDVACQGACVTTVLHRLHQP